MLEKLVDPGPVCVWCDRPPSQWAAHPCSAPDGDGHLLFDRTQYDAHHD